MLPIIHETPSSFKPQHNKRLVLLSTDSLPSEAQINTANFSLISIHTPGDATLFWYFFLDLIAKLRPYFRKIKSHQADRATNTNFISRKSLFSSSIQNDAIRGVLNVYYFRSSVYLPHYVCKITPNTPRFEHVIISNILIYPRVVRPYFPFRNARVSTCLNTITFPPPTLATLDHS